MKHIIFDCDGVIVDSEILFAEIAVQHFARVGFHAEPVEYCSRFAGMMDTEILEIISKKVGKSLSGDFYESLREEVEAAFHTRLKTISGMPDLIRDLPISASVVSNSYLAHVEHCLNLAGILPVFQGRVLSSEMVPRPKPFPDVYELAIKTGNLDITQTWVVEDSATGVKAATGSGLRVIGFLGGGHVPKGHGETLKAAGAEKVVGNAEELWAVLF